MVVLDGRRRTGADARHGRVDAGGAGDGDVPGALLEAVGIGVATRTGAVELRRHRVGVERVGERGAAYAQRRGHGLLVALSVLAGELPEVLHHLLRAARAARAVALRHAAEGDPVRVGRVVVVAHAVAEDGPEIEAVVISGVVDLVLHPRRSALHEHVVRDIRSSEGAVAELDRVVELVGGGGVERRLRSRGEAAVVAVQDHAAGVRVRVVPGGGRIVPHEPGVGPLRADEAVQPRARDRRCARGSGSPARDWPRGSAAPPIRRSRPPFATTLRATPRSPSTVRPASTPL